MSRKVLLITRLSNQNAGNEALSAELIRLCDECFAGDEVRVMDRYPMFFGQFDLDALGTDLASLPGKFDALVRKIAGQFQDSGTGLAPIATADRVKLDLTAKELTGWFREVKRKIAFRRRMVRLGLMGKGPAAATVNSLRWADLVIWNPAGEIHPPGKMSQKASQEVYRLLILLRLAQLAGRRTMIINHTFEVEDPILGTIIRHVYSNCAAITVRDGKSRAAAISLGIDGDMVTEVPDIVYLVSEHTDFPAPPAAETFEPGTICLAINGRAVDNRDPHWDRLLTKLKATGRPLAFLSNAMHHDLPFIRPLAERHGVRLIERQPTYLEMGGFYRNVGVLISSRLHSNIIALCGGIPVVSLESRSYKMTGVFEQLGYPITTTKMTKEGWDEEAAEKTRRVLQDRQALAEFGLLATRRQAELVRENYRRIFR